MQIILNSLLSHLHLGNELGITSIFISEHIHMTTSGVSSKVIEGTSVDFLTILFSKLKGSVYVCRVSCVVKSFVAECSPSFTRWLECNYPRMGSWNWMCFYFYDTFPGIVLILVSLLIRVCDMGLVSLVLLIEDLSPWMHLDGR